jgi:uncharacterized membrane protein YraQ (UPF0718 family)
MGMCIGLCFSGCAFSALLGFKRLANSVVEDDLAGAVLVAAPVMSLAAIAIAFALHGNKKAE